MSSRKQVINAINATERELLRQQVCVSDHEQYLLKWAKGYNLAIIAMVLPAFILGWQGGKKGRVVFIITQLTHVFLLATIAGVKRKLWLAITKAFNG